MTPVRTIGSRIGLCISCGVLALLIQFALPLAPEAAAPPGPDAGPANAKPVSAATTGAGSGGGTWQRGVAAATGTAASPGSAKDAARVGKLNSSPTQAASLGTAASGLQYYPLAHPIRLYDSRPGMSALFDNGTPEVGGLSYPNTVAGISYQGVTIPANAAAVTGNVTVVADQRGGAGFVTLYPDGSSLPTTSNANYVNGQVVPNAFTVALGPNGVFRDFVSTTIDVIVDITGYYAAPGTGGLYFHLLRSPIRYLDTRPGTAALNTPGTPDTGGTSYSGIVAGISYNGVAIPADATAISGNATVVADQNAGPGFLTLFPSGATLPTVSNNNYVDGQVVPNAFFVGLGGGKLSAYASTTIDVIIDINGYFSPSSSDSNGAGVLYNTLPYPIRMYDTRAGSVANGSACFGGFGGGFPNTSSFIIPGGGTKNGVLETCQGITIPTSAIAVTGNATVVADLRSGPGFVTIYPGTSGQPNASNLNYVDGQVVPNFFVVGVGPITSAVGNVYTNAFQTFNSTATDQIFDLNGYFA